MRKIIALILAGLIFSTALAGCGMTEEEWDSMMNSSIADIHGGAVAATAPATEPDPETGWKPGDEVWFVAWCEGDEWPYPGIVLDAGEEHLIVSRGWDTKGEQVAVARGDCYRTSDEAWAAAGKEPVGEGCTDA